MVIEKYFQKHPSMIHAEEIKQLCKPLETLDITTFSHLRVFDNNKLTVQCNNVPFLLNYLNEKYYIADPCVNVQPESTDLGKYIIWDSVNCTGRTAKMLIDSNTFNFKHVFSIIKKKKEYVDFYHFGTHLSNPIIHQVYINNLEMLDRFIQFFNTETKKSKILSSAYDIILNTNHHYSNIELNQDIFNTKIKRKISSKKYTEFEREYLTKKEMECAELVLQSKTSKEIARELGLSYRTIEDRIHSLKIKLNAKNKADLIVKLLENT